MSKKLNTHTTAKPTLEAERIMGTFWESIVKPNLPKGAQDVFGVPIIQTGGQRSNCLGATTRDDDGYGKWWEVDGKVYHELTISAELLNAPILDICSTLVHGVAHYVAKSLGQQEMSKGGRHSIPFMEIAQQYCGLSFHTTESAKGKPQPINKSRGFIDSYIGPELEARIWEEIQPDASAFDMFRVMSSKPSDAISGTWTCQTCDQKAKRTTADAKVNLLCGNDGCNAARLVWIQS